MIVSAFKRHAEDQAREKKSQNVGADGHEVLSLTKELLVKIYFCF